MKEKQQQLLFEKGITNVPSDALCSDNALEESVGMIYDNGEHRVIQHPKEFMTDINVTVVYVHRYNNEERYITLNGTTLGWGTRNARGAYVGAGTFNLAGTGNFHFTSVGKTLVVSSDKKIQYFLWKPRTYTELDDIPDINFSAFMLKTLYTQGQPFWGPENSGSIDGIIEGEDAGMQIVHGSQDKYNDFAVGLYNKNLKSIAQMKGFAEPFFIRLALELYDGSYTHITEPFLLFPSVTENTYLTKNYRVDANEMKAITSFCMLFITQSQDYRAYSDIVKDVVVFVSDGIKIYDTAVDQPLANVNASTLLQNGVFQHLNNSVSTYTYINGSSVWPYYYHGLKQRAQQDIVSDIKSASIFYKLCSLGLKPVTSYNIADNIEAHTLENLTTQEQLPEDDYFSRSHLTADYVYSYNSRLNITGVERGFFEGFHNFIGWENAGNGSQYDFYVKIKTDEDYRTIHHQASGVKEKQGIYFYYPDARATEVLIIKNSNTVVCNQQLTEHPNLNGAYFFSGLPGVQVSGETTEIGTAPSSDDNDKTELLVNYIIQSEVNNPYLFKAAGYFKVGTGKIKGMSTITQALSEGQFGQYPLLVFSESGIWGLSVASTGYYSSVHPMSREVCNNADSITQTDGAVFFTSNKGLMVVVGNQVKCVSDQLSGKEEHTVVGGSQVLSYGIGHFLTFLKTCKIAYDYRDSLLWIFGNDSNYRCCYVYSIKNGTFGKCEFASTIKPVNFYPDYLVQIITTNNNVTSGKLYSLLERPDINSSDELNNNTYGAHLLTRPMKLENALALKSIMQIKHIFQFTPYNVTVTVDGQQVTETRIGKIKLRIFASNNLMGTWEQITSLRGKPWKYYRFLYDFDGLKAIDRFAGTMLITQERRIDKLR